MCEIHSDNELSFVAQTVPVTEAVGMVLAHDITEIRPGEFKGRAFKKGHIVRQEDIERLRRLGKERLYVLRIDSEHMHEDEAAYALAKALMGEGVEIQGSPKEGRINIIASVDGLLKINTRRLHEFNMLGEVMCATLHTNTLVKKGQTVAATRAIPLVIKKSIVHQAVQIAQKARENSSNGTSSTGIIEVKPLRKPRAGVVITGNEIFYGRLKDAFAPVIREKLHTLGGQIIDIHYAPDDPEYIEKKLRQLLQAGADLLITTGGMSVDPDDVTRFAIRRLGVREMYYGSAVLPGAMFLIAYLDIHNGNGLNTVPIVGIPACGMYHRTTVFDLVLPRILAGEHINRKTLAEMGHGGLCLNCKECRYPVCPFGK